jgi:rhamnogalacturonyl hydrolase YesR
MKLYVVCNEEGKFFHPRQKRSKDSVWKDTLDEAKVFTAKKDANTWKQHFTDYLPGKFVVMTIEA